jgi:hypothetical protein
MMVLSDYYFYTQGKRDACIASGRRVLSGIRLCGGNHAKRSSRLLVSGEWDIAPFSL